MIYLLEEALEVAKNYAHDENSDELLAGSCEMGVVGIEDENGEYAGQGINVFMPTECTGDAPAFVQILMSDEGELILDEGLLDHPDGAPFDFVKDMLNDQIDQARKRITFCIAALAQLKPAEKTPKKTLKNRKFKNAV